MRFTVALTFVACSAFGQTAESRMFEFKAAQSAQQMQELGTVIRSTGEIRNVSVDTDARRLSVQGSAGQIALADWLLRELDQPVNGRLSLVAKPAYTMADVPENVVRVYYLPSSLTVQQFQEMASTTRAIAEIRRALTYNAPRALVLRGTAGQIAAADWILAQLTGPQSASGEYRMSGPADDIVRVFYLPGTGSIQDFQEVATLIRSIGEIRLTFTYNLTRALILRGTADQLALTEWLVKELAERPDSHLASGEYRLPWSEANIVRVFYLPSAPTVQSFQETAMFVRTATQIRRAFTLSSPRALALRGTADQIAAAERLIDERR